MTRPRTLGSHAHLDRRAALGLVMSAALLAGCASSSSHHAEPLALRTGPTSPAIDTPYPYDLYTHCGIQNAYFENRWWAADSPTQDDPARGSNPYTGSITGTMTLTSPTTARFTGPAKLTATFHPLDGPPMACS
jgi:hypothetical protein